MKYLSFNDEVFILVFKKSVMLFTYLLCIQHTVSLKLYHNLEWYYQKAKTYLIENPKPAQYGFYLIILTVMRSDWIFQPNIFRVIRLSRSCT